MDLHTHIDGRQGASASATDRDTRSAPAEPVRGFSIRRRTGYWRDALRRRLLAGADILSILAATSLAPAYTSWGANLSEALVVIPLALLIAKLQGLYDRDHRALRHLTADEWPVIVTWCTMVAAAAAVLVAALGPHAASAADTLRFWLALVVITPVMRMLARGVWRRITPAERILLIGTGTLEAATRRKLELFSDVHARLCASIRDAELEGELPAVLDAAEASTGESIDRIVLATTKADEDVVRAIVAHCRVQAKKLTMVPPARGMFGSAVRLEHLGDLPLVEYHTWDVPRSTVLLKRALDVAVSGVALVALAPLMLLIALAVRLDSPGPSVFAQRRAGRGGNPFRLYKFRTMVADAERRLAELVSIENLADPVFKLREDPRVTRVGRLLRRSSLDELPQLFNVLRGDMSLVGPRPEQVDLVARYGPEHRFRLEVHPGLTGPMQVYGRGDLTMDERLAVEREYVENMSLGRDLRILMLTCSVVLRGDGAY